MVKETTMKKLLPYLIIFCLVAALFFWLQSSPTLGDGDSFYHAKIADLMIKQRGPVKNFPWMPFTILQDYYYNHHFLFHLYLIPFIYLTGNPLLAIKVATILLAALFFALLYWFLKRYQIKYALIYILFLLSTYALTFRLNLDKAPAASLIFFLLGLHFLFQRKKFALAILSFFYVWLYNAWPIILVATICYCLAIALKNIIDNPPELPEKIKNYQQIYKSFTNIPIRKRIFAFLHLYFLYFIFYSPFLIHRFFSRQNIKLLLSCFIGLIGGIIINPYFPNNLKFFWVHIFKIGLITPGLKYNVGAEWYPYDPFELFTKNLLVCCLWLFTFAWFWVSFRKPKKIFPALEPLEPQLGQTKETLFLIILTTIFFIYTIKARRMAEYFLPLVALSAAFTFNRGLKLADWHGYWQNLKKFIFDLKFLIFNILLIFLFVAGLGMIIGSTIQLYQSMRRMLVESPPFDNFQKASQFLKENAPPNSIIFHDCWTYFPMLFYHNDQNRYIIGLDATFMAEKNSELHKLWCDIAYGREKENLSEKIRNNFNSSYVIIERPKTENSSKKPFLENLDNDDHFQKIYEDKEAYIYKIK